MVAISTCWTIAVPSGQTRPRLMTRRPGAAALFATSGGKPATVAEPEVPSHPPAASEGDQMNVAALAAAARAPYHERCKNSCRASGFVQEVLSDTLGCDAAMRKGRSKFLRVRHRGPGPPRTPHLRAGLRRREHHPARRRDRGRRPVVRTSASLALPHRDVECPTIPDLSPTSQRAPPNTRAHRPNSAFPPLARFACGTPNHDYRDQNQGGGLPQPPWRILGPRHPRPSRRVLP